MPEYINNNTHSVHLTGPDGRVVKIRSKQRINLSDFFDKYRARGFIQLTGEAPQESDKKTKNIQTSIVKSTHRRDQIKKQQRLRKERKHNVNKVRKVIKNRQIQANLPAKNSKTGKKLVVGKEVSTDATALLQKNLEVDCYPISNNIGVGVLSFNRFSSLKRLIDSIKTYTDLKRTTIFISDDNSTDEATIKYLDRLEKQPNFVVLRNSQNLGIADNSNRLLQCLSRFSHGLLLNDDVEVLQFGWEYFYSKAARQTGFHHFSYYQPGVYGASEPTDFLVRGNLNLKSISERPHGAILSFTNEMLDKCGGFNNKYGQYGMEHIDWSLKPHEFGLQESGFYDVSGSQDYFVVHPEESAVKNRGPMLKKAKEIHRSRKASNRIELKITIPSISYVVPFRNTGRQEAMQTVINNIRAQRYPHVQITMVEQDSKTNIVLEPFQPFNYVLAQESENPLFNKSKAFNIGVSKSHGSVILHDADMLVPGSYTKLIAGVLLSYDACHVGHTVIYTTKESAESINQNQNINLQTEFNRVVGYFEGGSLACTKEAYWRVGGFNEDFWGYGCEDCEFYARLSGNSKWYEKRQVDFLHMWHGRVSGWNSHHEQNKQINAALEKRSMRQRISDQRKQLIANGYKI